MSTSGPKPKPSSLKKLQGNPGKRPLNEREPKPQTEVKRPWGLGKGEQRKFWNEHAAELERMKLLTGVDVPAFRLMAEHYAFAVQAARELHALGDLTVEGREGPKKHPLVQVLRDNSQLFKSYAAEFGLTPSSRTRLQLPAEAEQLSLADRLFAAITEAASEDDHDD
jgi:P27 family predicted phage terminase small subunit